jgi:RNA-directed DNA polymerase
VWLVFHGDKDVISMNEKSSITHYSEDISDKDLAKQWSSIPLEIAQEFVKRLQTRIAKAVKEGKYRLAKRLQYLLTHSFYAKFLAVRKVSSNRGKRTAGVDGEIWTTSLSKMKAVHQLSSQGYQAKPLRRIFIPKLNSDKLRPLSIPTMSDRAMQALYAMALSPWAESTADKTSFGFRMNRNAQDAAAYTFLCLSRQNSAQWVLEGDIQGCFDNFAHNWMLANIPLDKRILNQFLKAGYIYDGILYRNYSGTPQGGIISPILANMALDGMEYVLKEHFKGLKVHLIRFADDFVITASSKEVAEECKEFIVKFLNERGLKLSEEKTKIVHINDGFDFIGWNFRKFNDKLLIRPSKKAVAAIIQKMSEIVKSAKAWTQDQLIERLNPIILGWSMYHRYVVSSVVFKKLDWTLSGMLWTWAKRRHSNKGKRWIFRKYWQPTLNRIGVFKTGKTNLRFFSDTKIRYRKFLKLEANPFLDWDYFEERNKVFLSSQTSIRTFLFCAHKSG